MTTAEILAHLRESDEEFLTADGFDDAIVGVVDGWFASSRETVVCYDYERCVKVLVSKGMDEEVAAEYLEFNTLGAYVGPHTPVFLHNWRKSRGR